MRKRGFTLIEILVVIGIISLLLAYLVVQFNKPIGPIEGTKGLLLQLSAAIDSYKNEFRAFPPDGYDEAVTAPNGQQLKGSACLTYYLAWMYPDGSGGFENHDMKKPDYTDPEHIRMVPVHNEEPFWGGVKPTEDLNGYGEIIDKWLHPLRYDNCERTGKDGTVQYSPGIQPAGGGKDPDPRETENNGRPYNAGAYDLWSCGADGDTEETSGKDDIIAGREEAK